MFLWHSLEVSIADKVFPQSKVFPQCIVLRTVAHRLESWAQAGSYLNPCYLHLRHNIQCTHYYQHLLSAPATQNTVSLLLSAPAICTCDTKYSVPIIISTCYLHLRHKIQCTHYYQHLLSAPVTLNTVYHLLAITTHQICLLYHYIYTENKT